MAYLDVVGSGHFQTGTPRPAVTASLRLVSYSLCQPQAGLSLTGGRTMYQQGHQLLMLAAFASLRACSALILSAFDHADSSD